MLAVAVRKTVCGDLKIRVSKITCNDVVCNTINNIEDR
jgi:hypothetical protein